jgi:hypothetical protein
MKKLATIVICTTFFALGLVGMASAQVGISGKQYKMTATGSCLHSTSGFNEDGPPYTPIIDGHSKVWGATTTSDAIWRFNQDGTVLMSGMNYPIDFPPGNPQLKSAAARQNPIGFPVPNPDPKKPQPNKWDLDGNVITITNNAETVTLLEGSVSDDGSTIIINSYLTLYNLGPPLYWAVCNTARVLIRTGDIPLPQ